MPLVVTSARLMAQDQLAVVRREGLERAYPPTMPSAGAGTYLCEAVNSASRAIFVGHAASSAIAPTRTRSIGPAACTCWSPLSQPGRRRTSPMPLRLCAS